MVNYFKYFLLDNCKYFVGYSSTMKNIERINLNYCNIY